MLVFIALASATDVDLTYQGRVLGPDGNGVSGEHRVDVVLLDGLGGTLATRTFDPLALMDGYFAVTLTGVDSAWFSGDVSVRVDVDLVTLSPAQPLVSVPHAARAAIADGVRLSDVTDTCDATTTALHGTLRYRGGLFEGCTPNGWVGIGANEPDGSAGNPAQTCYTLHFDHPTLPSAVYWLDPSGASPFQAWCDMGGGDGGWTLVAHKTSAGSDILSDAAVGTAGAPSGMTHYKLHTDDIDDLQALSSTWRVYGSVTGKETDIAATGLPGAGWTSNEYRQLRYLLSGRGLGGCGSDTWDINDFYPVDGSIPSPSCYAYPTTANFYDYKSNSSGGNGQGQTIWLR